MAERGRPVEWTPELEERAWDYVENYESYGDPFPSMVGLCGTINRARSTIYKWCDDPEKDFSDIARAIHEKQERILCNKGVLSEFNPSITKLLLTKHGYSDRQELTGADGGSINLHFGPDEAKL